MHAVSRDARRGREIDGALDALGAALTHLARAALEGIALQVADLLHGMQQDAGYRLTELRVDGGASVNFLRPLPLADAAAWWRSALADPHAITWVARDRDGARRVVGVERDGGVRARATEPHAG